jgi:hypothetical protein
MTKPKFPNANHFHKSLIQQQMEYNAIIENFKNSLASLVESYTIKGNVFGCPQGKPVEFETGYFVVEAEKDNLQDAIREMTSLDKCIRIEEEKFQVGVVNHYLSECALDKTVIDIENQVVVER